MGNCIGKKSGAKNKHRTPTPSTPSINKRLSKKHTLPLASAKLSPTPHVVEFEYALRKDEECEEQIARCSLSSSSATSHDAFLFIPSPTTSLSIHLPSECEHLPSHETFIDPPEDRPAPPVILIADEQETSTDTMGHFFAKEADADDDQQVPNHTDEMLLDSLDLSPSSSLSSLSCETTPFSSQDHLILSSSSSSADTHPVPSSYQVPDPPQLPSVPYTDQIYFDRSTCTDELFAPKLPVSFPRCPSHAFLNEFHQNILAQPCRTLSSVIDSVAQQQFIRIHQRTKPLLIEHQQFQCVLLRDIQKIDAPPLIFDDEQKLVYMTKYARWNNFQSVTCATRDTRRFFSSCDHCLSLLSGSKLNQYLRPFLYANTTYQLAQMYFNELDNNNNTSFGYISTKNPNQIEQIIINNAKLTYSYDLDVDHTCIYFVVRVQSWPHEIQSAFEQRQRLWPSNVPNLFHNTCFIRYDGNEHEPSALETCHACEKALYPSLSNSAWSYTYAAIESQLVQTMSDEHIRFASIAWNYLHGRTQGQLPFRVFKHALFYFFEQYTSDSFLLLSDLLSSIRLFVDLLSHRLQGKSLPHYFDPRQNLYTDDIAVNFNTVKTTYLDLKTFSVFVLPKSSLYLYHLMYLIEFQSNFLTYMRSTKTNLVQTILETHELVIAQLSSGVKTYRRQLDSTVAVQTHRPLTLDCLYQYQEENVQVILDYLPFLREKEPSLLVHSLWSIFIQYFNSLFGDLFIS